MSFRNGLSGHGCELETHRTRRREHGTVTLGSRDRHSRTAVLDIEHSLRWHDPGRFNGYVLSPEHFAGTPVDAVKSARHAAGCQGSAAGPAGEHFGSASRKSSALQRFASGSGVPDSVVLGKGEDPQWLYTVCFEGRELWGDNAEPGMIVSIDAFEPYLEPA